MSFTEHFDAYACEGDAISCEAEGFTLTARIVADDCPDAPDQRQDGFWPSLYKDAPGFIGPGNGFRQRFAKAQAKAEAVMEAWRKGEWFYCGIVLCVTRDGIELDDHAASLWGVECNYPGADNSYLTSVANELLPEALDASRAAAARLAATVTGWAAT
ncbi:MAG: hypothetical protein ABJL57_18525 [Hyphomonas sp.]|uniref:hypothetical protein n=1 Tax=Hyphomonas sp. TaxID=87 RepID=UPI003264578C